MRKPKPYGFWLPQKWTDFPNHYQKFCLSYRAGNISPVGLNAALKPYNGYIYIRHLRRRNNFRNCTEIVGTYYYVGFKDEASYTAYLLRWT